MNYVIFKKDYITTEITGAYTFISRKLTPQSLLIMKRKGLGFIPEKKGKFKQLFPKIDDRDLRFHEGQERKMIELLGSKLGKTTKELLSIIIGL